MLSDAFKEDLKELEKLERALGPEKLEKLYEQYQRERDFIIAAEVFLNSQKLDSTLAFFSELDRLKVEARRRLKELGIW